MNYHPAPPILSRDYPAILERVIDGDTLEFTLDLGCGISLAKQRLRLLGINAPETRTRDKLEKAAGLRARERVQELLGPLGSVHRVHLPEPAERDSFGRLLGNVVLASQNTETPLLEEKLLTQILLDEQLVQIYDK